MAKEIYVRFIGESIKNSINSLKREQILYLLIGSYVCQDCLVSYDEFGFSNGLLVSSVCIEVKNVIKETNSIVRITNETAIHFFDDYKQKSRDNLADIRFGGSKRVLEKLKELVELPVLYKDAFDKLSVPCPKGVLLYGPPGVGKTLLVKEISRLLHVPIISINIQDIQNSTLGQSELKLRLLFEKAEILGRCIIFIDEIDALCSRRDDSGQTESRLVAQFLTLMESTTCVIIAATNRPQSIDPALRRPGRFDREFEIPLPNFEDRVDILKVLGKDMFWNPNVKPEVDLIMRNIAKQTQGWSGADLSSLIREASIQASKREFVLHYCTVPMSEVLPLTNKKSVYEKDTRGIGVSLEDIEWALTKVVPTSRRGITSEISHTPWDLIGGLEDVKHNLKKLVEWPLRYQDTFRRLNVPCPKGILLHGPPGCSKTTLVRAMASSLGFSFITLTPAQIYSPFIGEPEATIREAFKNARHAKPSILFLDEIDAIVGNRDQGDSHQGILTQILTEMDGAESTQNFGQTETVIVVAATNRIGNLDAALLRPGRFDKVLYIPPPDYENRKSIFNVFLNKMLVSDDVDVDFLASKTNYCSGADIQNLCREASLLALQESLKSQYVEMRHFLSALESLKPSLKRINELI